MPSVGSRDIVEACVRAADEPLPRHGEIARHAASEVVRLHSRDVSVLEAVHVWKRSLRPCDGSPVDCSWIVVAEVDSAIEPMVAVRVTVALRAFDRDARAIDVSVRPPVRADQVARGS